MNLKRLKRITGLLLILVTISSCATTERKARDYYLGHKDKLAKLCLDCFETSLKPVYIEGKTVTRIDTLKGDSVFVMVDCPDGTKMKADCPPNEKIVINNSRIDTFRADTWQTIAKVKMLEGRLEDNSELITRLNKEVESERKAKDGWRKLGLIALGIIGVYGLLKAKRVFRLAQNKTFRQKVYPQ